MCHKLCQVYIYIYIRLWSDVMFVKCRCLFTSVKLCLICNLQKKNCNLQNIYLVFCSCLLVVCGCFLVVCGHFVVVCGCLLMVWRHLVVVCRCLLVDCGSLWLFTGGLWLFADSLGLFGGGLWSFVLACGLRLLPVLVITYIYIGLTMSLTWLIDFTLKWWYVLWVLNCFRCKIMHFPPSIFLVKTLDR